MVDGKYVKSGQWATPLITISITTCEQQEINKKTHSIVTET